jgi:hypothetical protein
MDADEEHIRKSRLMICVYVYVDECKREIHIHTQREMDGGTHSYAQTHH